MRFASTCIIALLVGVAGLSAQPLPCDGSFYVVMTKNGKSVLYNLQLEASGVLRKKAIPLSEPDRRYTCLGMSVADLYLYALDFNTKELLRIDALGKVTNLGVPENLDPGLEYWAGDVAPEGRRLVVIGRDPRTGIDKNVFAINLKSPTFYAGSSSVIAYAPTAITDIATDPIRGIEFGYDKTHRQIVHIGTNTVAHHNHIAVEPILEALFFDKQGQLYGYGSGSSEQEQSTLFAIDKIKGGMRPVAEGESGMWSDGCSCAFSMSFDRRITPEELLPCSEFTIDYWITNHAGIGKTDNYLQDRLPEPFLITEVVDHSFTLATIESAEGTNELLISNLDILLGENIIRVKGRLRETTEETYETQAVIDRLPLGLGGRLVSNDPFTSRAMDPNVVRIRQPHTLRLQDYVRYSCNGDTAVLRLPFAPLGVQWSTGDRTEELRVTKSGWYGVEATGECFTFKDSIFIGDFPPPLVLDVGEDLEVQEGTSLRFAFRTNAGEIKRLRWWSAGDFDLSCADCASPTASAVRDNTYYLELTDAAGCSAIDSVQLRVTLARELYAPNAISPNGDGDNDFFYIQGAEGVGRVKKLLVFDRWGRLLFENQDGAINDPGGGWDGRFQGRPVPNGVYVWSALVEFWDGQTDRLSGEVVVLKN